MHGLGNAGCIRRLHGRGRCEELSPPLGRNPLLSSLLRRRGWHGGVHWRAGAGWLCLGYGRRRRWEELPSPLGRCPRIDFCPLRASYPLVEDEGCLTAGVPRNVFGAARFSICVVGVIPPAVMIHPRSVVPAAVHGAGRVAVVVGHCAQPVHDAVYRKLRWDEHLIPGLADLSLPDSFDVGGTGASA